MKKYNVLGMPVHKNLKNKRLFRIDKVQISHLKTAAEVTLGILGAAGVATVALLAPNLLTALNEFNKIKFKKPLDTDARRRKAARVFYYLKRHGYIRFKGEPGRLMVLLTKLGKEKLHNLNIDSVYVPKPLTWDRKWWQIAADIPTEEHRQGADLLRRKLKEIGLYSLQRTLWYYPYDPRPQIEFIVKTYKIEKFVTVMEISRMDRDDEKKLTKYFKKIGVF